MTLAVGIAGEESIWLMVDRRLTANKPPVNGRYEVLTDDATKLLVLDATDGVALLGYSGLGLTVGGMEPS
ncbi:MAG TPA: hypothetical protein VHP33_17570, partial [Polyangiaceae bacterium]|nr:hypothetical protein [Polyangiaceae bacterium]